MNHPQLNPEEELVLRVFLEQAVQVGLVYAEDEESENLITETRDVEAILAVLGDTEMEFLYIETPEGSTIGHIDLVYGNDATELIIDHSDNEIIDGMVKDAMLALERSRVFSLQG